MRIRSALCVVQLTELSRPHSLGFPQLTPMLLLALSLHPFLFQLFLFSSGLYLLGFMHSAAPCAMVSTLVDTLQQHTVSH